MTTEIDHTQDRAVKVAPSAALEAAAREVLDVPELAEIACTGSDAPAEHALGLLADAIETLQPAADGAFQPNLALCAEHLAEGAKLVIVVLDELIAEHGDLPISDALADRLIESVGLLDRAQAALAAAQEEGSNHG